MGEDGVAGSERIREEEITVYEKKLSSETSSMFHRFILRSNYRDYIKNLVKNGTDAAGKKWLTDNEYKLVEKELDRVANKVSLATMKSLASFRDSARAVKIDELKKRAIGFNSNQIKWLATKYKNNNKITDSIINLWDEWATDADAVLENLKGEGAKLGKKVDELREISAKQIKVNDEKQAAEKLKEDAKKLRVSGLITQFKTFRDKPGKRSYRELLFMRNILGWIKKWEALKTDDTFDPDAEIAALDATETVNQDKLVKYNNWVGYGTHFTERLENWKKMMVNSLRRRR